MDIDTLLEQAIQATVNVQSNQIFKLRDLFEGHIWESFVKGDRLQLGRAFKNAVTLGKIANVAYHGKADNNSAQYIKVGSDTQ